MLARPQYRVFVDALRSMGLQQEKAEQFARECGRSVTILQRRLPRANFVRPQWSTGSNTASMLSALLAGRWNGRSEADREILCLLAGVPQYAAIERQLQTFRLGTEPPLQKIGEMWSLTAPTDAFELTAGYLTDDDLERFQSAFRKVFGKIDPKVDIPLEDWILQDIKGKKGHSSWLRSGLAETLLLIAERGTHVRLTIADPQAYANSVVHGLPGLRDDWRVLASLRDQFERLMEAAPSPLLDSLEHLLEAYPNDAQRLFAEGRGFGSTPMHTGLLWGLEILAWNPKYLPRVSHILATLAQLDPGGRFFNRPINSLAEIFRWWHPGTNAPAGQRLDAIDLILEREPDVGWNLLAKLLPSPRSTVAHPTAKPRWRDFGDHPEDARTAHGQFQYLAAITDRALDYVGSDPKRWAAVLDSLAEFDNPRKDRAITLLSAVANDPQASDQKSALWELLRDYCNRQRAFRAGPSELISQIEEILPRLAPVDPVEQNRWLFDESLPIAPTDEMKVEHLSIETEKLRQHAIHDILSQHGIAGLVRLGTACNYPVIVASSAVPLLPDMDAVRIFLEQALSADVPHLVLAGYISASGFKLYGAAWRNIIRQMAIAGAWDSATVAALLAWWPDERSTWDEASSLGAAAEYWRKKPAVYITGTPEDRIFQIDRLIESDRAPEAFHWTAYDADDMPTEALTRLFDATMDALAQIQTPIVSNSVWEM